MSRKIIMSIIIVLSILNCTISVYAIGDNIFEEMESTSVSMGKQSMIEVKTFEVKENYSPKKDIFNLTLEEILNEINSQKEIQRSAHALAENARALGWPEGCQAIKNARTEWLNAQRTIVSYQKIYNKKIEEQESLKWEQKRNEFPVATEIWLYMKELGWNNYVCAGILGNMMTEVGGQTLDLSPYINEKGYYGICQWNKKYSSISGGSLSQQCNYLKETIKQEFNTFGYLYQDGFTYSSFLSLQNSRQAARAFAKCYERCGGNSYRVRENNAEIAYNYFVS